LIARKADGLPLAEGLDNNKEHDLDQYKQQAKALFKKMAQSGAPANRASLESGAFTFHYIIDGGVCYLTLAERSYPKKLAYQYLEELQSEFSRLYGPQVEAVARPYAFIKFDTYIQKTKKLYADSHTQRNISKLTEDISEVHSIMTKNIQEVLGHGERLDRMSQMSSALTQESKKYASVAKDLHRQALIRKYLPIAVVIGVLLLVLLVRRMFY
jgi:vesicle transport protein SEC22